MDLVEISKTLPSEMRHALRTKQMGRILGNKKKYARISAHLQGRNAAEGKAFGAPDDYIQARIAEGRARRAESR